MDIKNRKNLIFDLDGTLIDSVPDLADSVNFTLNTLGKDSYDEDVIRNWVGNGAQILVKRAISGKREFDDIDSELFKKAMDIFLEHYSKNLANKTRLYPNVKKTLDILENRGYQMSIVTNKSFEFVSPILKKLDIERYFKNIIGGDTLSVKKPNPEPLLYNCKKLNTKPQESIMVGDSKNDIISAKKADIPVVAVNYGYNYDEDISKYNPDFVISDFSELLEIVGE